MNRVLLGTIAWGLAILLALSAAIPAALAQAPGGQRTFDSPRAAASALIEAARINDETAIVEIFGQKHRDVLRTADPARDRELRAGLARSADECLLLRRDDAERVTIVVGCDAWPFPDPGGEGRGGLALRHRSRHGRAPQPARRRRRAGRDRHAAHLRQRAAAVRLSLPRRLRRAPIRPQGAEQPGKNDGLYWPSGRGEGRRGEPLRPAASRDGWRRRAGDPYNGYYFKILTRQGRRPRRAVRLRDQRPDDRRLRDGRLPRDHGRTGVKTFVVNHYGLVHEKDLGRDTAKLAAALTEYNPDRSWTLVTP